VKPPPVAPSVSRRRVRVDQERLDPLRSIAAASRSHTETACTKL